MSEPEHIELVKAVRLNSFVIGWCLAFSIAHFIHIEIVGGFVCFGLAILNLWSAPTLE